jgi:iron-desferrioxamine transport system substrate-binding protein
MTRHMTPATRRQFLAGAGALACLPALLAACGEEEAPESSSTAKAGPWTFTDDRGERITLDQAPKRLVVHEYAAIGLWDYGIRPVGVYGSIDMAKQPLFDGLDTKDIEQIGKAWGEINLEAMAALRPDLVVSTWWPGDGLLGGIKDDKVRRKIEAIAPIVGIHAQVPASTTIDHFEKLAVALGADASAPAIAAHRERYEKAVASLKAAVAEKPGLKAMAVYVDPEILYLAKVSDYADLREYRSWGLRFIDGESKDPYWQQISWENADRLDPDLILLDARAGNPTVEDLAKLPVWREYAAVKAGQVTPWHMEEDVSYRVFAAHIEELAAAVTKAERLS